MSGWLTLWTHIIFVFRFYSPRTFFFALFYSIWLCRNWKCPHIARISPLLLPQGCNKVGVRFVVNAAALKSGAWWHHRFWVSRFGRVLFMYTHFVWNVQDLKNNNVNSVSVWSFVLKLQSPIYNSFTCLVDMESDYTLWVFVIIFY